MNMEPRKPHHMMQDLLQYAEYLTTNDKLNRWQYDDAYGCHSCQKDTNGNGSWRPAETHDDKNCSLMSLIKEVQAYIRVEEQLELEEK